MSAYRIKRQGEELVKQVLPDSSYTTKNGHDIDWKGIKINIRTRSLSGQIGNAFIFKFANKDNADIFVLVGLSDTGYYFWVLNKKQIKKRKSYYASIKESVPYPDLDKTIKKKYSA